MAILVQHTFTGANSTTGLPNADTGQVTEVFSGVWGIQNNQAYWVSGTALSVWESGQSDVQITLDNIVDSVGQSGGAVAFRFSNSSNYWLYRNLSSTHQLYKFVGGSATLVSSISGGLNAGTRKIKIITNGSLIECYVDDVLIFSVADTFNQTATKHGLRNHISTTTRFDNFLIESLTTGDTGTDGSTLFDVKQVIYQDSELTADTKQSLYVDEAFTTDLLLRIYSDGYTQADTKQILYELSSAAFDMLQEYYEDGQIGSTPFDMRMVLYSDGSTVFDSTQAYYESGSVNVDLKQAIYESGQSTGDMRLIIYADEAIRGDLRQLLYSDAYTSFDTKQVLYDAETQVIGVIKLKGKRELYVYLKGKRELEVHLKGGLNVTEYNQNFTMESGDSKVLSYAIDDDLNGATLTWEMYQRGQTTPLISKTGTFANANVQIELIPTDTQNVYGTYRYELQCVDVLSKKSTLAKGVITLE